LNKNVTQKKVPFFPLCISNGQAASGQKKWKQGKIPIVGDTEFQGFLTSTEKSEESVIIFTTKDALHMVLLFC